MLPPSAPPSKIVSPALSVVLLSSDNLLRLLGVNLQRGDTAYWVSAAASSCDQKLDTNAAPRTDVVSLFRGDDEAGAAFVNGSFFFGAAVEVLKLCYRFNYNDEATKHILSDATDYLLFPDVRVATLAPMSATPTGTGVGCAVNVTISGLGFAAVAHLPASCLFANLQFPQLGSANAAATFINDTTMVCESPAPPAAGSYTLLLRFGGEDAPTFGVLAIFTVFHPSAISISSLVPGGGNYNLATTVQLTGNFLDFGKPRCRFGNWTGGAGVVTSPTTAWCSKPAFPSSAKDTLGCAQDSRSTGQTRAPRLAPLAPPTNPPYPWGGSTHPPPHHPPLTLSSTMSHAQPTRRPTISRTTHPSPHARPPTAQSVLSRVLPQRRVLVDDGRHLYHVQRTDQRACDLGGGVELGGAAHHRGRGLHHRPVWWALRLCQCGHGRRDTHLANHN